MHGWISKSWTVFALALLVLFIHGFARDERPVTKTGDLNTMFNVIQTRGGKVERWLLLLREEIPGHATVYDLEKTAEQWKSRYPHFRWDKTVTATTWKLEGTYREGPFTETLQVVAGLTQEEAQGFSSYKIEGTSWNQAIRKHVDSKIRKKITGIFHENAEVFTCLNGTFSDKIDFVDLENIRSFALDFRAEIVELINEKDFIALTGLSPFFAGQLRTLNGPFNVQIALRLDEKENRTNFAIGTPIITAEY